MRFAVLASHEGTTLQAVLDACAAGEIEGSVALVVSNNSKAGALQRAAAAGVHTLHISANTHGSDEAADTALLDALKKAQIDLVLLLGYMKKLGEKTLHAYGGRILNTHPALLPKYGGKGFFGRRVHEAVIAAGEAESGATIHVVEAEYDTGPIVAQVSVPVSPDDDAPSLEARVKHAERQLLVRTLKEMAAEPAASNY